MSGNHSFLAVDVSGRSSPFPVVPFARPTSDHAEFLDFLLRDIAHGVGIPESMMPTAGECVGRGAPRIAGGIMTTAIRAGRVKTRVAYRPRSLHA